MLKLTQKLLKLTAALLSLITLTGATTPIVTNPTTIQAKKAKKKHYIIAKTSTNLNLAMLTFTIKRNIATLDIKCPKKNVKNLICQKKKIQKAKSKYDVPKINDFNNTILSQYSLLGYRWNKTNLTFKTIIN